MARSLCKPSLSDASREVSLQPLSHDTGSGDDERRFWDHRPLSEPDTDLRDISWFILLRFNCHLHGLSKKDLGICISMFHRLGKQRLTCQFPSRLSSQWDSIKHLSEVSNTSHLSRCGIPTLPASRAFLQGLFSKGPYLNTSSSPRLCTMMYMIHHTWFMIPYLASGKNSSRTCTE